MRIHAFGTSPRLVRIVPSVGNTGAGGMRKALEREIEDIKDKALDADYDTSGLKGLIECHRDTMFSITEDEAKTLIDLL